MYLRHLKSLATPRMMGMSEIVRYEGKTVDEPRRTTQVIAFRILISVKRIGESFPDDHASIDGFEVKYQTFIPKSAEAKTYISKRNLIRYRDFRKTQDQKCLSEIVSKVNAAKKSSGGYHCVHYLHLYDVSIEKFYCTNMM